MAKCSTQRNTPHEAERTNSFVTDLYRAFLLREPEPEGVVDWLEQVGAHGRAETIEQFAAGDELDLVASSLVPTERVSPAQVPRDGRDRVSYDYVSNRINLPGWEYDASGNQTKTQRTDGQWQRHQYDAANRLVRVTSDDGATELQRVTYGASNARLVTEETGLRTYYAWRGGHRRVRRSRRADLAAVDEELRLLGRATPCDADAGER